MELNDGREVGGAGRLRERWRVGVPFPLREFADN